MPLFDDRAEVIISQDGDRQLACNHCHEPADDQAQTIGDLPFLLMCPSGRVTLGERPTAADRLIGIRAARHIIYMQPKTY
jgi:hypothetical protein